MGRRGKLTDPRTRFLYRLALTLRKPVHEIRLMPAWEVRGWAEYLSKIPGPDDRIEISLAHLASMYSNAHRGQGASPRKLSDFLLFKDPWQAEADEASGKAGEMVFNSIAAALMEQA